MPGRHRKPTKTGLRLSQAGALTIMATAPLAAVGSAMAATPGGHLSEAPTEGFLAHHGDSDRYSDEFGSHHRSDSSDADDASDSDYSSDARDDAEGASHRASHEADEARGEAHEARETSSTGQSAKWDRLARCESTSNWDANTGNGFKGGLQFTDSTWRAYGGKKYAHSANQASREQQIEVAKKVQQSQGWEAWPSCSRKLGYA
jgi:hypothetical protein